MSYLPVMKGLNMPCKKLTTLVVLSIFGTLCAAQSTSPLGPDSSVTGTCQGHEKDPGCVLPNLFGSRGLTLYPSSFTHYAHFIGSAQSTLNQTLSTAIATQLALLPIISPASGFTYKYESSTGTFVPTSSSFGPIYTERADTIGRGKVSFGVSYQRFRFGSLDGVDLHNVPAVFGHVPKTGPNDMPEPYEADVIATANNIDLKMDQTMLFGTVGVTNRIDLSIAIPIVSVRLGASSDANIVRVSGPTNDIPGVGTIPNPHQFNAQGGLSQIFISNGSASGIGDVTIRLKGGVFSGEKYRVALAMDIRTPTGDARRFLGSGAIGLKPFVAVSAGTRFSPHVNVGYQWNGESILAGNLTGVTISEDEMENALIQSGPATKERLPGAFFYSAGVDLGVTKRLTVVFDYLGQTVFNAPRIFQSSFTTLPGPGATTLPAITAGKDTIGLNSGAAGIKYNLFNRLLLTADILFRLDNRGLRQDITPLIALSYAFGQ